ncbi:MAG TPA: hypothetical protein VFW47_03785 [Phenylobacterium sp.]|nr:hypothetical protein [Phenylobacterium sp.]
MGPRVILVGGSSNAGKSTVAACLAARLGWAHVSTDSLARHPGRPWRPNPMEVPPHVAEHYLGLTDDELLASVLGHYRNMWPLVEELVRRHAGDASTERLVLEGSALWPELVAALTAPQVSAVWLTADESVFETRILRGSGYDEADDRGRAMIAKFLERTRRFDRAMREDLARLGLPQVEVGDGISPDEVANLCLAAMTPVSVS